MTSETTLLDKLKSKNWKDRNEAYIDMQANWESHMEALPLIQNETNVIALETGIDALLKLDNPPEVGNIKKILSNLGNSKTSLKTKIMQLINFVATKYIDDLVSELCVMVGNKSPKNVAGAVKALTDLTPAYDYGLELVGDKIEQIFNNPDKNVRQEGLLFCIEVYKKHGDAIKRYLTNLKPIQIKELEEEFGKIAVSQGANDDKEFIGGDVDISNNFMKNLNHEKWSIRLETLEQILKKIHSFNVNSEFINALLLRISDPNNQVFFATLDILAVIKPKNQRIYNALFERLKDKKTMVTDRIKDCLVKMKLAPENISSDLFSHKSPQVKENLIDLCIKLNISSDNIIKNIAKCTSDVSADVRNKSISALRTLNYDLDLLPPDIKKKVGSGDQKKLSTPSKPQQMQPSNKTAPVRPVTPIRPQNSVKPSTTPSTLKKTSTGGYCGPTDDEKKSICESFYLKYPFFNEKRWNIRLEAFNNNLVYLSKEPINDLAIFFCSHKDAIFQLNLAYFDLLLSRRNELTHVKNTVMTFCSEKITETKLKNKIHEIFLVFPRKDAVLFLLKEIYSNRSGKKFCALVGLLANLAVNEDEEVHDLFKESFRGVMEKKALDELRLKLKENVSVVPEAAPSIPNEEIAETSQKIVDTIKGKGGNVFDQPSINKDSVSPQSKDEAKYSERMSLNALKESSPSSFKNQFIKDLEKDIKSEIYTKRKYEQTVVQVMKKDVSKNRKKCSSAYEDVFTEQFMDIIKTQQFNNVVEFFYTVDITLISDLIIEYFISNDLQSTYFNSLLLNFISKKYILEDDECRKLLVHFIDKNMVEELNMIDRVYPVTKLFVLYQSIGTDESIDQIIKLVDKYKIFRGDKEKLFREMNKTHRRSLRDVAKNCVDFLSFVDEIEESFCKSVDESQKPLVHSNGVTNDNEVNDDPNKTIHTQKSFIEFRNARSFVKEDSKVDKVADCLSKVTSNHTKSVECKEYVEKKEYMSSVDTGNGTHQFVFDVEKIKSRCSSIPKKIPETKLNLDSDLYRSAFTKNSEINDKIYAPSVLNESFNIEDVGIEESLECLSISSNVGISTPNLKKFRKEFETPVKKKTGMETLEEILDALIDSDQNLSEKAIKRLGLMVSENISSVLFSANSIISSISVQLCDPFTNPSFAHKIFELLLQLSQSKLFCEQLRKETLTSINFDLITMMNKLDRAKQKDIKFISIIGDILTNVCLNSTPSTILSVYLGILEKQKEEIALKLIWRHYKTLILKDKSEIQLIFDLFESFYNKNVFKDMFDNKTTFKVLQLHVKEIVKFYSENVYSFSLGKNMKALCGLLIKNCDFSIQEFRGYV